MQLKAWLLAGTAPESSEQASGKPWWQVMCLTGVDYFSTLAYQAGIAVLAAGLLSPIATLVLVCVTLFGALPVYRRVAVESPNGEGSIALLAKLVPRWWGKFVVLILLGFAATDFIITMTLSAADAAEHFIENPFAPPFLHGAHMWVTIGLLLILGAVFLKGVSEAVGVAVALVGTYLALNVILVVVGIWTIATSERVVMNWEHALRVEYSDPFVMIGVALVVFPKLALGLSGFETGVAVMTQIKAQDAAERVRGARKLLTGAAIIMCSFLLTTSFIATLLIPLREFEPDGEANGRALSFLAHRYLGDVFGTVYDLSTITILWFAGASAMAGLLTIVPRYLPRFGMAPEWTRISRPLVVLFLAVALVVTWHFDASVDKQAAAYATGVLVLITSASFAVTISAVRAGHHFAAFGFGFTTVVFVYTTIINVFERSEGLVVAAFFITITVLVSIGARVKRSFELRATSVTYDAEADSILDEVSKYGDLRIIAHRASESVTSYDRREFKFRGNTRVPRSLPVVFLEVRLGDASEFSSDLVVEGRRFGGHRILRVVGAAVPNTIAAVVLDMSTRTEMIAQVYFEWTEGNPLANYWRFWAGGRGAVAEVTYEVIRRSVADRENRPQIHVG